MCSVCDVRTSGALHCIRKPRAWCTRVCSARTSHGWSGIRPEWPRTARIGDERPAGYLRRAVPAPGGEDDPPRLDPYWISLVTTGDWLARYVVFPAKTVRK